MSAIHEWAVRWGISMDCFRDLQRSIGIFSDPLPEKNPGIGKSEAWAQSTVMLEASRKGVHLFRNNVGALKDTTGRVVRFGLANDSKQINDVLKSSDLIGLRSVIIGPQHVGHTFGQFVAREMKTPGWQYTGDTHEVAQLNFINLVNAAGGDACFATGEGSL